MIQPGDILGGKFRIERVLGRGGMGVVLVATHLELDHKVAIKMLHDELAGDSETVERFVREARAVAKLRSDHACRVSDVGKTETGAPYIVMESLDGEDLARINARGPIGATAAADYVLQACVAIAEAHAAGIVHRDLKPSNLFLAKRVGGAPVIKVLDFGIAKAPASPDAHGTRTTAVMGSPGYMSPEQLRSTKAADARSDIWSIGVLLYELASGRLPFTGETTTDLAVKIATEDPQPLDAEPAFVAVVMRCLAKDPAQRYPDVAALARELAACASPASRPLADEIARLAPRPVVTTSETQVTGVRPILSPAPVTTLGTAAGETRPKSSPLVRAGLLVGGGLAIAGLAVAGTLLVVGGRSSDDNNPLKGYVDVETVDSEGSAVTTAVTDHAVVVTVTDPAPPPPMRDAAPPAVPAQLPPSRPTHPNPKDCAPDKIKARVDEAGEQFMHGDFAGEVANLEANLQCDPNDAQTWYGLYVAACKGKLVSKAKAAFRHIPAEDQRRVAAFCPFDPH